MNTSLCTSLWTDSTVPGFSRPSRSRQSDSLCRRSSTNWGTRFGKRIEGKKDEFVDEEEDAFSSLKAILPLFSLLAAGERECAKGNFVAKRASGKGWAGVNFLSVPIGIVRQMGDRYINMLCVLVMSSFAIPCYTPSPSAYAPNMLKHPKLHNGIQNIQYSYTRIFRDHPISNTNPINYMLAPLELLSVRDRLLSDIDPPLIGR